MWGGNDVVQEQHAQAAGLQVVGDGLESTVGMGLGAQLTGVISRESWCCLGTDKQWM